MSANEPDDPRTTPAEDAAPELGPPEKKKDEDAAEGKAQGYVFRIVPADPKNAFDFEDVADK